MDKEAKRIKKHVFLIMFPDRPGSVNRWNSRLDRDRGIFPALPSILFRIYASADHPPFAVPRPPPRLTSRLARVKGGKKHESVSTRQHRREYPLGSMG